MAGDEFENALIDGIYEAAIVPESWPAVLRDTARIAHCREALLGTVLHDEVRLLASSPEFCESYEEVLRRIPLPVNERAQRLLVHGRHGFITDEDVFTGDEIAREPVYQEHLIPAGYGSGVATVIGAPTGDTTIVHCERTFAEGTVDGQAIAALDRLRPHFARAGLLGRRLAMERARAASQALELMGLPAAVLSLRGHLLDANALFQDLMPGVFLDRAARLTLAHAPADEMLAAVIAGFSRSDLPQLVRSLPIPSNRGESPMVVHVAPIRGRARDVFSFAGAIIVATPVAAGAGPDAGLIAGLFDLTPAEARLAAVIAGGHPPRDAASRLGVTEATARTTLKRILAKTGTRRQADLVGLLKSATGPR
ncbi:MULTISPECIES: helix-turn-helix transcriptional regulator [Bosea]|uniref:helix-turn-helix transcriptional regulator n=1 Tax=Bosea TaxID=85413 RepID=UPI0021503322|nr:MULTISPECIES: helix-turn-helix transcriptional regulator [Bosea]MCR4520487.1 helix-turn-helix transcriptional regulator [Bosea sp. 47.2.35]MDR6827840.1 DNA-binding CsgD family transcriptional regulator [Bosea robiniae]MDR6894466.1 DNA-binding CsgD family transcriptional regulator [Bosea sp. BE109]MDR7137946.1 DNA-binding CsgD family transcriptional regulator [Bosea sp. BE168]MDR7174645.1 DNA-binding CsgD family transcriptional regulator [Bosea sp. BE271]